LQALSPARAGLIAYISPTQRSACGYTLGFMLTPPSAAQHKRLRNVSDNLKVCIINGAHGKL
jgi:hypothetical protein